MKNHSRIFAVLFFIIITNYSGNAQQTGDTISFSGKKFKLLSTNLITNPGFENGFTGWTDATTTAAILTSAKFSISTAGGMDNSKYLIGLTNENSSSSGSIGSGWPVAPGKSYLFAYQVKYLNAATSSGSEVYLKTSLTNDKTSPNEPYLLIGSAQVNANGAWTQNYVYFTNSVPYSYLMVRFRWLNNRFGFDDFKLYEASEIANNEALQAVINEAQTIYEASAIGSADLQNAITTAQYYLTSNSPTEVTKAVADLQKAITSYKYANASTTNPLDMTDFIVNHGFDGNDATGWEGAGTVNYHEVEFYQKTYNMYQVISGLPAGKYRLSAKGFERPKSNDSGVAYKAGTESIYSRLYAKSPDYSEVNIPFNSLYKYNYTGTGSLNGYANTMAAAEIIFNNYSSSYYDMSLTNIFLNKDEDLTIGAKSNFQQNGYWALFDNFRLEYLGVYDINDLVVAINNRMAEAQHLLTQRIQDLATNELNAAIIQAQTAITANPLVPTDVTTAKTTIDIAIKTAYISLNAYSALQKAIDDANLILSFLEKTDEINKLQNAIDTAKISLDNRALTLQEINDAVVTLKTVTKSMGKQFYIPTWMMGDVNNPSNNWYIERSKQSKNWILFWEPGFGTDPGTIVDDCLALAEKCFNYYADSLKFIQKGSSKTDTYKMIIRLRYATEWEATGSGVDNTIGLLTLTPWALTSRGGQTIAHEVGHCFQYQVHCDNNDNNGWMYGYGINGTGGNGWWEQCAQWQAYKIFPLQQFTSEWFSGYMNSEHKNILHESPRYNNYFIQDYFTYRRGLDLIGKLWNKSFYPEDPVETYKRINSISQSQFNDEIYDCATRFTTWDIPALRSYGANYINSRPQPLMKQVENNYWLIDSTVCVENYGYNVIKLNAPAAKKMVSAFFQGKAGMAGYRKINVSVAGWRYGFVALLNNGSRVYSEINTASYLIPNDTLNFECPDNCKQLWLVVTGSPGVHWRHAWDDNDSNDEQWPYQVTFNNTNRLGYQNIINSIQSTNQNQIQVYSASNTVYISLLPENATIRIYNTEGVCLLTQKTKETAFSAELTPGFYIVSVNGIYSRKIVVK